MTTFNIIGSVCGIVAFIFCAATTAAIISENLAQRARNSKLDKKLKEMTNEQRAKKEN